VRSLLGGITLVGLAAGLVMGFAIAPREATQGNVQRIMYLHVPSVWVAYLAFAVVLVASIAYLVRRAEAADRLAHASAEVGVLFTGLTIATGSIWGKPTWGTWWTWDARLVTTAVLFFIYLGALLVRGLADDSRRGARLAAVVSIIGFLDIPVIHYSVVWFRTLHQPTSLVRGDIKMAPPMLTALLLSILAFTVLFAYLLTLRVRLARAEDAGEAA
jgi:heme exporter protein C